MFVCLVLYLFVKDFAPMDSLSLFFFILTYKLWFINSVTGYISLTTRNPLESHLEEKSLLTKVKTNSNHLRYIDVFKTIFKKNKNFNFIRSDLLSVGSRFGEIRVQFYFTQSGSKTEKKDKSKRKKSLYSLHSASGNQ